MDAPALPVPGLPGISRFGQTAAGAHVERVILSGNGLTAAFLTRGLVLQGLWLEGVAYSLTPGSARLEDYEGKMAHCGALVGPLANRLAGARAPLAGTILRLQPNEGPNLLHSGVDGLHARIWRLAAIHETEAVFTLDLPAGDGGFPGHRRITARYALTPGCALRLEIAAESDAPTLMNIANHSYWNLDGGASWEGHRLSVAADHWLPVDGALIPTGEIRPVGGAMDFRSARALLPGGPALDTCFCLAPARRDLAPAARLEGRSGLWMDLATTEPGLQVYDARAPIRRGGGPYEALALEPQIWPDAPNRPGFPSAILMPGHDYRQITTWTFGRNTGGGGVTRPAG